MVRFPRDYQFGTITAEELADVKNLMWGFIGSFFAGLFIFYMLEKPFTERRE